MDRLSAAVSSLARGLSRQKQDPSGAINKIGGSSSSAAAPASSSYSLPCRLASPMPTRATTRGADRDSGLEMEEWGAVLKIE